MISAIRLNISLMKYSMDAKIMYFGVPVKMNINLFRDQFHGIMFFDNYI